MPFLQVLCSSHQNMLRKVPETIIQIRDENQLTYNLKHISI